MNPIACALALALGAAVPEQGRWVGPVEVSGTVDGAEHKAPILVYLPKGYEASKGHKLLIALHGWGHAPEDLRKNVKLAPWADSAGAVIVLPAMGKTVYETRFYKETKNAWGKVPGARWIAEVVLPWARKEYAVSKEKAGTGIVGYSTGGRGAVLIAQRWPEFGFVASASGTYAAERLPVTLGESKIHAAVYGDLARHRDRWRQDDAVRPDLKEALAGAKVVLAHGAKDKVVPPSQLDAMIQFFEGTKTAPTIELDGDAAHDWAFWARALESALGDW